MQETTNFLNSIINLLIQYGTRVLGGLAVLVIGWIVVGMIEKAMRNRLSKNGIDPTAKSLLMSALSIILKMVVLLAAAATMGVETTSFIALLGSFGLAAGLALQGSLTNLAGGILLLIFRPIRVGDYVKAQGSEGYVKEIQLLTTILETGDNSHVYIPNGSLANGQIVNLSQHGSIRLHIPVQVGATANLGQVRAIMLDIMRKHPQVAKDPEPVMGINRFTGEFTEVDARPWCHTDHIAGVMGDLTESFKVAFHQNNIPMPLPMAVKVMD
jgi:small conductance mechanosensitive channel